MKTQRHIVVLGGGMFSMEPDNGLLDKYILNLSLKPIPKICFIPTASGDGEEYIKLFYDFYTQLACEPSHLALTTPPDNIEEFILDKDIIHVGGGSTKILLDKWREHKLDKVLKKALAKGIILTGMSAGAICWFESGFTAEKDDNLTRLPALGFVKGSFCPHYNERLTLRENFKKAILNGVLSEGFGVDDGAAIHFVNGEPIRVVSSRKDSTAYYVYLSEGKICEEKISNFYLGKISH